MAEVTSGNNLTVVVLDEGEAHALAGLLHYWDELKPDRYGGPLQELYDALVPAEEVE